MDARTIIPKAALAAALAAAALPCPAATYIVPTDEALIRKAGAVVRGTVEEVAGVRDPAGGIVTEITIAVGRVLKGEGVGRTLVVRQPGGRVGDEVEVYPGIGAFSPGEEVLLMVDPRPDRTFRLTDFALGKFHVARSAGGSEYLRRDGLAGARLLGGAAAGAGEGLADPDRDAAAFERFVEEVVAGRSPAPGYALPEDASARPPITVDFDLLGSPPGRWTQFDTGGSVTYRDNSVGDANCPSGCHAEVEAAVEGWNGAAGAMINLLYGGTDASIGSKCLGQLADEVQYNDPCDEMTDLSACSGTVALGGFGGFATGGGTLCPAKGNPAFGRISVGRISVNNGAADCLNSCNYRDAVTHEAGHSLGAGHSSDGNALMAPLLQGGRCGALQTDDLAFAQCVYPGTFPTCLATTAATVTPKLVDGILKAVVTGTGFTRRSIVQIDAGDGFVSAPKTVFKKKKRIVAKDVAAIWPEGVPVTVRVLNPTTCVTNELQVQR